MKTNMPARVAGRVHRDGTVRWRGRSQKQSRLMEKGQAGTRNEMERKGREQTDRQAWLWSCLSLHR